MADTFRIARCPDVKLYMESAINIWEIQTLMSMTISYKTNPNHGKANFWPLILTPAEDQKGVYFNP